MDSEMDPRLWSRFTSDIHGRLLSFLTAPVLCRFRTVCKEWNSIIKSSEFRTLCINNAKAQGYILGRIAKVLHSPGRTSQFSKSMGWKLLDVQAKRWYFIKHDGDDSYDSFESRSLAVDGGLACAYYLDPMAPLKDHVKMCVSNPIAKVSARLPPSPFDQPFPIQMDRRIPFLTSMVVEHGGHFERFKLFVMCCALHEAFLIPSIVFYDSKTGSWQKSSTNLARQTGLCNSTRVIAVRCMVFFQGFLFALITHLAPYEDDGFWQLWRFSPDVDAWTHITGAKYSFEATNFLHPQLIVGGNRLFLVSWVIISETGITFDLVEILLDVGRWEVLFQIPELQMEDDFETSFHARYTDSSSSATCPIARFLSADNMNDNCFTESPDITALGFEKAIILIDRKSGLSKEFNLVTCSFVEKRPFERALPCLDDVWYGQPMSLIPHPANFSHLRKSREVGLVTLSDSDD